MRCGRRLDRDEPRAIWQLGFDAGHDGCRTFGYDFLEMTKVSTWSQTVHVSTHSIVVVVESHGKLRISLRFKLVEVVSFIEPSLKPFNHWVLRSSMTCPVHRDLMAVIR